MKIYLTHQEKISGPLRIYLAGPMTGIPQSNFPAFDAEAARLRALGHTVFNPAEADRERGFDFVANPNQKAPTLKACMVIDLPEVCKADAIVTLPGWERSRGCSIEFTVAHALGIPVLDAAFNNIDTGFHIARNS